MSDARSWLSAKVVSDGNGGQKVKESVVEMIRKWSTPALLGLLTWMGKGVITEMIATHDTLIEVGATLTAVAEKTAANALEIEKTKEAVRKHDEWAKEQKALIEAAIAKEKAERMMQNRRNAWADRHEGD